MSYVPKDHDLDAINQYLDGLMAPDQRELFAKRLEDEPDLAALLSRFDAAFNHALSREAEAVSDRVVRAVKAEETVKKTDAESSPVRVSPWPQILKIAACLVVSAALLYAGKSLSPWGDAPALQAYEMYAMLEEGGFKAPRSCSPERFPEEMDKAVGVSLAFADDAPGVELLGWSYPDFIGGAVLSEDEIILMAHVEGDNVAVLIDQEDNARRLRGSPQQGLNVHRLDIDGLVLFEVGPHESPRILPLLSSPDAR